MRDVLHSTDVINLYFKATNSIDKIKGQVFNIGGGIVNSLSLLELFQILEKKFEIIIIIITIITIMEVIIIVIITVTITIIIRRRISRSRSGVTTGGDICAR